MSNVRGISFPACFLAAPSLQVILMELLLAICLVHRWRVRAALRPPSVGEKPRDARAVTAYKNVKAANDHEGGMP